MLLLLNDTFQDVNQIVNVIDLNVFAPYISWDSLKSHFSLLCFTLKEGGAYEGNKGCPVYWDKAAK